MNGQIAGLKQQGFRFDAVHVELAQQFLLQPYPLQRRQVNVPGAQLVDQKRRRAGLEPVGLEFAMAQVQQDVERVVDRLAEEVITVVPAPHFF